MSAPLVSAAGMEQALEVAKKMIADQMNLLVLFEPSVEELEDGFVLELVEDVKKEEAFMIILDGRRISTENAFYDQCRQTVPLADYMGSNLDALMDVFRGEAVGFDDKTTHAFWVWTHADILHSAEPANFAAIYEVLAHSAREMSHGWYATRGRFGKRHYERIFYPPRKPVTLIITGRKGTLGAEAVRANSFFHHLRFAAELFPDDSTYLRTVIVSEG